MWPFFNKNISRGSVVTQLRFGEIFNKHFIADLLASLPVNKF